MAALKRQVHPMPDYVEQALLDAQLMESYHRRPAYQRNDYVGWISRAKLPATRNKRLDQMLRELMAGDKYMGMDYRGQ